MRKIAMLLTEEFEDSEARQPLEHLRAEGFEVVIVAPENNQEYEGKKGDTTLRSDQSLKLADPRTFDGLFIPGGHSPENLRMEDGAVEFVRHFVTEGKPIAAICHGPQLLISAEGVKGRRMTCYQSVAVDLKNAGAEYVDQAVVTDGNLVTSRMPEDLPEFCAAACKLFSRDYAATP
ncbi:MAG: type 1 glutamine amidotransferase domain-containing protein [Vulcanimicrobiota bacterium]